MWPPVNSFSQVFAIYSQTAMSKQNTDSQIFHCCQDLNHAPSSSPIQTRRRCRLLSGFSFTIGVILLHSHQKFCCTSSPLGTAKAAALRPEYRCPFCFSDRVARTPYAHRRVYIAFVKKIHILHRIQQISSQSYSGNDCLPVQPPSDHHSNRRLLSVLFPICFRAIFCSYHTNTLALKYILCKVFLD